MRNTPINETTKSDENADRRSNAMDDGVSRERQDVCATDLSPERQARDSQRFLWIYVGIVGSLLLRVSVLDFESGDYKAFLTNWYDFFIEHGRWHGLSLTEPGATYPPLYLYLISLSTLLPVPKLYAIKLISVLGDYMAAWYVWRLARRHSSAGRSAWVAVTAFLFLPTVVMNGALWGQCDVLYTTGFLASLYYLLERRPVAALVAFGFSCALKPQAIFWCPLLAGLFIARRLAWKWVWVPAAVYVACGLPAILAGKPALDALWRWGNLNLMPGLTLGATNWYQWVFEQHPEIFWWPGVVLTLVATAFFVLWIEHTAPDDSSSDRWLVSLAFLSVLFPPFLLPGMHERYFFPADVLSVVYAVFVPRGYWPAIMVQFASAFTYLPYLFTEEPIRRSFLALVILAAIGWVTRGLVLAAPCNAER